jgi:hypothetical protein
MSSIYSQTLQASQGATFSFPFPAWLVGGMPQNLTGWTASLLIGVAPSLTEGVLRLTQQGSALGQVTLGGTSGQVTVGLTPAGTASIALPQPESGYGYDLQLTDPYGNVWDFASGTFVLTRTVPLPIVTQISAVANIAGLETLNTATLLPATLCYVTSVNAYYRYGPTDGSTPNGSTVVAAFGGGNWLLVTSGGPPTTAVITGTQHPESEPYDVLPTDVLIELDGSDGLQSACILGAPNLGERHTFAQTQWTDDTPPPVIQAAATLQPYGGPQSSGQFVGSTAITDLGGVVTYMGDGTRWLLV